MVTGGQNTRHSLTTPIATLWLACLLTIFGIAAAVASTAFAAAFTTAAVAVAVANATRKSNVESAATGSAYRALKLLVESMCGDPALLRCGLEKVWAEDGTVEWVAPESKERFVREGADCLIWNRGGSLEPNVVEVCGRME